MSAPRRGNRRHHRLATEKPHVAKVASRLLKDRAGVTITTRIGSIDIQAKR